MPLVSNKGLDRFPESGPRWLSICKFVFEKILWIFVWYQHRGFFVFCKPPNFRLIYLLSIFLLHMDCLKCLFRNGGWSGRIFLSLIRAWSSMTFRKPSLNIFQQSFTSWTLWQVVKFVAARSSKNSCLFNFCMISIQLFYILDIEHELSWW